MQTGQIFFSYSRADAAFALKLAEDLKKAGVDIWIDQIDIKPSEPWDEEIEKALQESYCMLVILSKTSVVSDNVLNEINYALESKKHVLPIVIEENLKKPINITRLQHIDFTKSYERAFNLLLNSLGSSPSALIPAKRPSRIIIPLLVIAAIIVISAVVIKLNVNKQGTGNASTLLNDSLANPAKLSSANLNGLWSTEEVTNLFDEHDKYLIYFNFEVLDSILVGSINFRSTVDYKNYNIKKGFLGGRIKDSIISFYTVEAASFQTDATYKNYYYGSVSKDEIKFTLQSDRPTGFPGQKFVAKRSVGVKTR